MSELVDVVASQEMCRKLAKLLPEAFSDSVFKWYCDGREWWVVPREFDVFSEDGFPEYPAVTALEVMEKIAWGFIIRSGKQWKAGVIGNKELVGLHKNPAMAAAKLLCKVGKGGIL